MFLVRHAKAGDRSTWEGDDRRRPLTKRGQRQAEGLVELLAGESFKNLVSSPYVRCIQSVVPLACDRTTSIEVTEALAEGATLEDAVALIGKYADEGAVLCTHGDVVPMLLGHLKARGMEVGDELSWPKGSTWRLRFAEGEVVAAEYLPPFEDGSE